MNEGKGSYYDYAGIELLTSLATRLQEGDDSAVQGAVSALEEDPWHLRSGYLKEDLMRYLRRLPLSPEVKDRLRRVVLDRVDGADRRDFRWVSKMAASLANDSLVRDLERRAGSDDSRIARHAI